MKKVKLVVQVFKGKYDPTNKGLGIGAQARECIKAGYSFKETLELIKKRVPNTHFSARCFHWYKNHMRRDGLLPKWKAPKVTKKAA